MDIMTPLFGGILIGLSASLLFLFNGRVAGISGIVSACLVRPNADNIWRGLFILG